MKNKINSKYIKSSNLIFLAGGVMVTFYLISLISFRNEANPLTLVMINLGIIGGVGLIIRQGRSWTKYLSLTLFILYVLEASSFLIQPDINIIPQVFFVAQILLVTWATIILFVNFHKKLTSQ